MAPADPQDLVQRRGLRQSLLLHRLAPWLIAFFYYHVSWLLFVIRPAWSYRLNADFEDHAEHEYMSYVAEHPELEAEADPGSYAAQYGQYGSLADLFRQIGHDERVHKLDSLANMSAPRPHQAHAAAWAAVRHAAESPACRTCTQTATAAASMRVVLHTRTPR